MKFSPQQQAAIDKRGASVVLGAAAGSGKTTVMVNRIADMLSEGSCTAQELLVLTFTRAAAGNMLTKLEEVISKRLAQYAEHQKETSDSASDRLSRALRELSGAQISTFDSFCITLVRRYFFLLDIQADAVMLDENQANELADTVVRDTLEEASALCERGELDGLLLLYDMFSSGKQDDDLMQMIRQIYDHCRLYPDPDKRLEELCGRINIDAYIKSDMTLIKKRVVAGMDAIEAQLRLAELIPGKDGVNALATAQSDKAHYEAMLCAKSMDELLAPFDRMKTVKEEPYKSEFHALRQQIKDQLGTKDIKKQYEDPDTGLLNSAYDTLLRLCRMYGENMEREYLKRNVLTFDAAAHLALKLASMPEVASELKRSYKYIFVDEDQDSNRLQRCMLSCLTDAAESNLFMVGDIKQSIYRFRNAEPELFIENMQRYASSKSGLQCLMHLNNNFRSHSNILTSVNLIFEHNMRSDFFDIDYDSAHTLIPPEDAEVKHWQNSPEHAHPTEVVLLKNDTELPGGELARAEAKRCALLVLENLNTTITDPDGSRRKATFGDMVILHRAANKRAEIFREVFASAGIPFEMSGDSSMLDSYEVGCIISLLQVVDNRLNDFAMFSAMRLFGFTFDEIISIRVKDRKSDFSSCIINSDHPRAVEFIKTIEHLRFLCSCRPIWKVIWEIYELTGFYARCASLDGGADRCENLRAFASLARRYCSADGMTLSAFLRLMEKGNMAPSLSDARLSGDCVHMMTIHKSKGLEFPIVILAGCGDSLFKRPSTSRVTVSRELGLALSPNKQSDTCPFIKGAVERRERELERSEHLRNLYVAATRACNKLIFTGIYNEKRYDLDCVRFNASSYFDFILPVVLAHPDGRKLAQDLDIIPKSGKSDGHFACSVSSVSALKEVSYKKSRTAPRTPSPQRVAEAVKKMSFEYPYKHATTLQSKMGASQGKKDMSLSMPELAKKVSGADVGSGYHTLLEYTDFVTDPELTLKRLVDSGLILPEVAKRLELDKLRRLMDSPLGRELRENKLIREAPFTMREETDGESYLVQGIIDCFYIKDGEAVLLDFKSDRVSDIDDLTNRYRPQLELYKKALKKCFGVKCRRASIYYLDKNMEVEI